MEQPNVISPNALSSPPLDKKPKAHVVRLNKMGLVIAIIVLLVVLSVILSSTTNQNTTTRGDTDTLEVRGSSNQENTMPREFETISAAIPGHHPLQHKKTNSSAHLIPPMNNKLNNAQSNKELIARHDKLLIQALDAPIATAGSRHSYQRNASSFPRPNDRTQNTVTSALPPQRLSNSQGARVTEQNQQQEKRAFLTALKDKLDNDTLHSRLKSPGSPYQLMAGSVIPAITAAGVNSDLPGQFTALVRQNVYDTVSGHYILIPQGSKIIMIYDSQLSYGQQRVLVAAKRLIFPNGQSMNLQGMPGTDSSGYAGFHDMVNNHYFKLFGSAAMLGLISAGFQLSQPQQASNLQNPSSSQTIAAALGQQLAQISGQMMQKNMNIQPTVNIRPGYRFTITVTADMVFPNPYQD